MECKTLLRAGLRAHRGTAAGVAALFLLAALALGTVLTVYRNAVRYIGGELDRLGCGDLTAWVSGLPDAAPLAEQMAALEAVASVGVQPLIFSEYEIGEHESDSEGQLIVYQPERYAYRFFAEDLSDYAPAPASVGADEVYASASMVSMFGVRVGDSITFPIARSGGDVTLRVAGFYEDPMMGSSMIGMKGFLVSAETHAAIAGAIADAGRNGLARAGFLLHVTAADDTLPAAQLNILLNERTDLQQYTEFTHSRAAIEGFMLTLQNVFTGLLLVFAAVLLLAAAAVLAHSIGSTIEQDYANMGSLKTIGVTGSTLRVVQLAQYLLTALCGMAAGMVLAVPAAATVCRMTVTTIGVRIPAALAVGDCLAALVVILLLLAGFVWLCTRPIVRITPLAAMRGRTVRAAARRALPLHKDALTLRLALRQLAGGLPRYLGAGAVAVLLVCFASVIGRVDAWLGPHGEGLMDAFNPADLHIAAQPMGETSIEAVEQTIAQYTAITDAYALAMPSVSVDGVDMTANVITEPERFHLLAGQTCRAENEVVLTEFVAADLGVAVGDTVTVAGARGSGAYVVSGIYQCANDMGMNLGMNRAGYAQIGTDSPNMWCMHYFLADPDVQPAVMQALTDAYGGDVYLHENSWPGLAGILSAMRLLMVFLYAMVALFVLAATLLTAEKLLRAEQKDLAVYRTMGFAAGRLRRAFALRFGLVALVGSALGTAASAVLTDPLAAALLRTQGISDFASHPRLGTVLLPSAVVTALFLLFAYLAAGRIARAPLTALAEE